MKNRRLFDNKAAGGRALVPLHILLRGPHHAAALGRAHAACCAAVGAARALAHLDKHQGAIRGTHNGIYFAAATARSFVIALQQNQPLPLQPGHRCGFCRVAALLAAGRRGACGRCKLLAYALKESQA